MTTLDESFERAMTAAADAPKAADPAAVSERLRASREGDRETLDVTHDNFDDAYLVVKAGLAGFFVPTYGRTTTVEAKQVKAWERAGKPILRKDSDGRGFRMRSGQKKSVYLIAGQLKLGWYRKRS